MKSDSLMYKWFLEEFKGDPIKVNSVNGLLRKGHRGLAETVVIRNLKSKYDSVKREIPEGIKINENGASYYI